MSENEPHIANGAGDAESAAVQISGSNAGAQRDALVTKEAALECARQLFLLREGGPHRSEAPTIALLPTREEITIAQEALKEVLGEKGSEKRAAANKLAERGLIDLEEGLGHWLGDRFRRGASSWRGAGAGRQ